MSIADPPSHELPIAGGGAGDAEGALRERLIGVYEPEGADDSTPTLFLIGAMHGNEPSGVAGIEAVLAELASAGLSVRARVVGLRGNVRALASGERFVGRDLNRMWTPRGVEAARANTDCAESRELVELIEAFEAHATAEGPSYLLDLHTTSSDTPPFMVIEDRVRIRRRSRAIPVVTILGFESMVSGILTDWFNEWGEAGFVFEAGKHDHPESPMRHADAVWLVVGALELGVGQGASARVGLARRRLGALSKGMPHFFEARYRHGVTPESGFVMRPGHVTFEPVRRGSAIADDRDGVVVAPMGGRLFMPLYQARGEDGFFIVRRAHPFFLWCSRVVRLSGLRMWIHWLPGVSRCEAQTQALVVDRRIARFLVHWLFATIGYRRSRRIGHRMVFARTLSDLESASAAIGG